MTEASFEHVLTVPQVSRVRSIIANFSAKSQFKRATRGQHRVLVTSHISWPFGFLTNFVDTVRSSFQLCEQRDETSLRVPECYASTSFTRDKRLLHIDCERRDNEPRKLGKTLGVLLQCYPMRSHMMPSKFRAVISSGLSPCTFPNPRHTFSCRLLHPSSGGE